MLRRRRELIAFDLDDVLLVSSHTHWSEWGRCADWKRVSAGGRFGYQRVVHRLQRSRFRGAVSRLGVRNSLVEVAFRPGAVELLLKLEELGIKTVLVTASARQRVEYLLKRLPWFGDLFRHVVCREQISVAARKLMKGPNGERGDGCEKSWRLHQSEPPSLAWKTPLLVSMCCGIDESYSILVDDHIATRDAFARYGLEDRLIWVDGSQPPDSDCFEQVADEIESRLGLEKNTLTVTERDSVYQFRLEDPYYLPTLAKELELSPSA